MRFPKRSFTARGLVERVEEGPVRFLVPGVVVAALVVSVVNGYTPLEFQAPEAAANTASAELDKKVDASKLERKKPSKKVAATSPASADGLVDGTYTGYSRCTEDGVFDYWLALDVTVEGGEVTGISNVRGSGTGRAGSADLGAYDTRNAKYLDWAARGHGSQGGVVEQIMKSASSGSAASIDTVSGATYSSESILEAYQDALSQASGSGAKGAAAARSAARKTAASKRAKARGGLSVGAKLADGTWRGYDRCTEEDTFDYYLAVDVTVKNGRVTRLANVHGSATGNAGSKDLGSYDTANDTYLGWAENGRASQTGVVKQIMASAAKGKIASSIDTVSGATYSSQSILNAYLDALGKSAKAAGSAAKVPSASDGKASDGAGETGTADSRGKSGGAGTAAGNPNSGFSDGTYTAYGFAGTTGEEMDFAPYYVGVTVTVSGGKVSALAESDIVGDAEGAHDPAYRYDAGENAYYFKRALDGYGISGKHPGLLKQINAGLEAGSALVSYDTISGATYTSDAIIDAYTAAVALARPQAGAAVSDDAPAAGTGVTPDGAGAPDAQASDADAAGEAAGSSS